MGAAETSTGTDPTPDDLVHRLASAGFDVGAPARVTTTVLDTFDARLHGEGMRLDHTGGELVLHAGGGGGSTARLPVARPPRFPADLAPGPFRSRLAEVVEIRAVEPTATVASSARRAERRNGDGKVTSVVTIHEDVAVDGHEVAGWLVTVDELTGYAKPGDRARDIVARHAGDPSAGDAVEVALAAAGVERTGHAAEPGIPLDPDLPAIEGFRLVLANLDDAIELNRQGTIDDVDTEFLHDLRVAVRRSRSIVRHGRRVLPPDLLAWAEPGLKLVGTATSPLRDLDVQVLGWEADLGELDDAARRALDPLHRRLLADRKAAHTELAAHLRGGEVADVLARWRDAVHGSLDPATGGPHADHRLLRVVKGRIRRAQALVLDHGRAVTPDSPADDVHEVRKDAKKLRYLLECFAGLFPDDERTAFVKRLKKLQSLLGDHQDAAVQADELRHAADALPGGTAPATYVAVGQLVEHLERKRHRAREGFAERFAEYDSTLTHKVLADMVDGADGVKVLATYSIKGGVGKTTAAVNLAAEAARSGARVLLWDLDPQGATTFFVRVKPRIKGGAARLVSPRGELADHVRATDVANVDVLPADFSLRHLDLHLDASSPARLGDLLTGVRDAYDVALLDCPPGITVTSEGVFAAADALLVPTIPATLSARTLEQLDTFLAGSPDPPIVLPFVSMIDRRRTVHRQVAADLAAGWPRLLTTQVPNIASVERMGLERAPLMTFAPSARGTIAYRDLWAEIAAQLWR